MWREKMNFSSHTPHLRPLIHAHTWNKLIVRPNISSKFAIEMASDGLLDIPPRTGEAKKRDENTNSLHPLSSRSRWMDLKTASNGNFWKIQQGRKGGQDDDISRRNNSITKFCSSARWPRMIPGSGLVRICIRSPKVYTLDLSLTAVFVPKRPWGWKVGCG